MYDPTSPLEAVNECRKELFTKKAKVVENIPPTKDAMIQQAKKSDGPKHVSVLYCIPLCL